MVGGIIKTCGNESQGQEVVYTRIFRPTRPLHKSGAVRSECKAQGSDDNHRCSGAIVMQLF